MHRAYHPPPKKPPPRKFPLRRLIVLLAVGYAATGLYVVQTSQRAVVRRCGRVLPQLVSPGLHFGFPWGIDQVSRVKVFEMKRVSVGGTLVDPALGRKTDPQQAERLTGDRNLVQISAIVQYQVRIDEAPAFLFRVANVPALIESVAAAAMSTVISSMKIDDAFTVQRIAIQNEVMRQTQAALDRHAAGVQVTSVSLEGVAPPQEVAEAFRDVGSAREDCQRAVNEAQGYANRLLPQSRGEAQRLVLDAEGYAAEATEKARGDADRFLAMLERLSTSRSLTLRRLVLETLEEVLPRLKKVVLDAQTARELDLGLIEEQP